MLREGTYSCPISFSGSQLLLTLALSYKPYHQRRPNASDRRHIPGSTLDSVHSINLTAWLSRALLPVTHLFDCPGALPSPYLLITTWQLVKAHGVTRNEPKINVICYITVFYSQADWTTIIQFICLPTIKSYTGEMLEGLSRCILQYNPTDLCQLKSAILLIVCIFKSESGGNVYGPMSLLVGRLCSVL